MRFVHTSDWHVGKSFSFADEAAQSLRDERLEAVTRIGRLALAQDAPTVLVAGDIYDVPTPVERTLWQPIERMRAFPALTWHLIPGNHDAHTAHGPWERLRRQKDKLPENIRLHLTPEPAEIAGGAAWLLPAVLTRRHAYGDPTADLDGQATPEGATRIGLAPWLHHRFRQRCGQHGKPHCARPRGARRPGLPRSRRFPRRAIQGGPVLVFRHARDRRFHHRRPRWG